MLIDPISIHYSGSVANTTVPGPDQATFINAWRSLLLSVGWTEVAQLYATGVIVFPLGAPVTGGVTILPKTVVGCNAFPGFLAIGGYTFTLYDPFTETPAAVTTCTMVPMDVTALGTLQSLAGAITSVTPFDAAVVQNTPVNFTMTFTAKLPGPEWNLFEFSSTAGFYVGGGDRTNGGGYRLQSAAGASIYQVAATNADTRGAGIFYLAGNILFTFTLNGADVTMQILDATQGTLGFMGALGVGAVPAYTIVANPHGFAVFDLPHNTTTQLFRAVSLFVMAPYVPTAGEDVPPSEDFRDAYSVFIVGPNYIGGPPAYDNLSIMCLDGAPYTNFGHNPSARLLCYRSPDQPLLTARGVPITTGAYVMYGTDTNSDGWIVGKLWDCALVSDVVDVGAIIEGRQFLTLGYSDGSGHRTRSTLLMASGTAVAIETGVTPPTPPPPPKSGVVNLFGDGITWVSGDTFDAGMVDKPITVGGDSYIVAAYIDSHNLTLNAAKTIIPGATYTAP